MAKHPTADTFSEESFPLQAVTGTIIAGAFAVFERFGYGFLESVYRRSLGVELRHRGVHVEQEARYDLCHLGEPVGFYKADTVVDFRVKGGQGTAGGLDGSRTLGCSGDVALPHSTGLQNSILPNDD